MGRVWSVFMIRLRLILGCMILMRTNCLSTRGVVDCGIFGERTFVRLLDSRPWKVWKGDNPLRFVYIYVYTSLK